MEEELNYLSEKIQELLLIKACCEHQMATSQHLEEIITEGNRIEDSEKEIQLLENILTELTLAQLTTDSIQNEQL